jgi:hypothetical protein
VTVTLVSVSHLSSPPSIPNVKCIAWNFDGSNFVSKDKDLKKLRFENGYFVVNDESDDDDSDDDDSDDYDSDDYDSDDDDFDNNNNDNDDDDDNSDDDDSDNNNNNNDNEY